MYGFFELKIAGLSQLKNEEKKLLFKWRTCYITFTALSSNYFHYF